MLTVAVFIFILQSKYIKISNAWFYIFFNIMLWLGTLLSLSRTPSPDTVLYIVVSLVFPFLLGLVFIPTLSIEKGKLVWIGTLILAAILWGATILTLWLQQGENIRHTLAGKDMDHNMISLCLAIAATASMMIALYGDFAIRNSLRNLLKLFAFLAAFGFWILSFLTYSRSGFIITTAGIFFGIFTLVFNKQVKKFILILFVLLMIFFVITPIVQISNPIWFSKFDEVSRLGDSNTSVYVRTVLVNKAWRLIQENPIIGIGPEVFRTVYSPDIGQQSFYMVHNTYLAAWVEKGILGVAGFVVWALLWAKLFVTKWRNLNLINRILMSAFVPFFVMLFFLDIGGLFLIFMLALFSGLQQTV